MDTFDIDLFKQEGNIYLIPPYLDKKKIMNAWEKIDLDEHLFICSSGTTSNSFIKTYALSKRALFENAKAVNSFLMCEDSDQWLASLTPYHIGGISIYARTFLLGGNPIVLEGKWQPEWFLEDFSYASLVPLQLYDLVKSQIQPHPNLKGIFIGGDFASKHLIEKAYDQGWPLIMTYGMTEVCSQLASEFYHPDYDGFMKILPIHKVKDNIVQSSSLYTAQINIFENSHECILSNGYFELSDNVLINEDKIKPLGRSDEQFKYKGRLFHKRELLDEVHKVLFDLNCLGKADLVFIPVVDFGVKPVVQIEISIQDKLETIKNKLGHLSHVLDEFTVVDRMSRTITGKIKK